MMVSISHWGLIYVPKTLSNIGWLYDSRELNVSECPFDEDPEEFGL